MFFYELDEFGWNWLTFSSTLLFAITVWQYRAQFLQAAKIWEKESAESVSLTANTYLFFTLLSSLIYGILTQKLVIAFTGGTAVLVGAIMVGAWRFGTPTWIDVATGCAGLVGISLFLVLEPELVFFGFSLTVLIPVVHQLVILYKKGATRGVLQGELLLLYVVKNLLLMMFAFIVVEPVYIWLTPVWLVLSSWVYLRWLSRPKSLVATQP
jgi:uncharacterized protein with PQ loop repeat